MFGRIWHARRSPKWSPIASEDLRAIGDSLVAAEIFHIASEELRPEADDAIEGELIRPGVPQYRVIRYRRCVRTTELSSYMSFELGDVDQFRSGACDYSLIYGWLTPLEQKNLNLWPGLVILKVVSNAELIPYLTRSRPDM